MAGRYTPSFFAAVAGFIVWVLGCDFMVPSLSAVRVRSRPREAGTAAGRTEQARPGEKGPGGPGTLAG
ncbi:hypothetical protein GCM10018787_02450 [Streptomyces thermodiastaticus]|nr:hypothetical protein GCM10018787_02450 [Streptomyces thermodiastaticus]